MSARSLKSLLIRQWMLFATCIAVLFASAGLLLLFLLEDSFIDRQLKAAARSVAAAAPAMTRLPPEFSVYPASRVPLDIHAQLPFAQVGRPFEMRRADRRYVHVLLVDTPTRGRLAVVYDVTDQLTVTPRLGTGLLIVLGLTALTLLAAAVLARAFVGRLARRAEHLVEDVRRTPHPGHLRELSEAQEILEFQRLLGLHADVWEAQLTAVESERQTLAYLGHELRTPLQSAQTSLALLAEQRDDCAAFERLQRALARLTRASRAALWLATDRAPDLSTTTALLPLVRRLANELAPLAAQTGQVIDVDMSSSLATGGPDEIAETIVANVLLNAIQHGGAGPVVIHGDAGELTITNVRRHDAERGGFGFGLQIVRRLGQRIGWSIDVVQADGSMTVRILLDPPTGRPP
ncbi:sensor histidine kinase [Lysobacter korlensis]|uniref:histidine kinase n=1 Tax=Lysobacter korlensis TaxID=553636 RepID=A0ABV6S025_9GAMM